MSFWTIFALIGSFLGIVAEQKAVIDAGGVASTPVVQIGTDVGKPLYARGQVSTDKTFGGTASGEPVSVHPDIVLS